MGKNSCISYPEAPNGEDSRLYKDLLHRTKDRPLANYLYSSYLAKGKMAEAMDKAGFERNRQGEHRLEDVLKFMEFDKMQDEVGDITQIEVQLGATDSLGQRIAFSNAEEALQKADDFNSSHKGLTAYVEQHDDIYHIIVDKKDAHTASHVDSVKEKLQIWNVYKQAFNNVGVDITALPQEVQGVVNAMNIGLAQYLSNLQLVQPKYINRKDALLLFSLNPDSVRVQRAVRAFGSAEEAAQALDDFNHGAVSLSDAQRRLLANAVNEAKEFQGVDMDDLIAQTRQLSKEIYSTGTESDIRETLRELDKKYKIDSNEAHSTHKKISTLSQAASDAAMTLQRQIRKLEREKGSNAEGKRLEGILYGLMHELARKKYYSGIMNFLTEASSQLEVIDTLLNDLPQTGTELDKATGTAKVLRQIHSLREQYYFLVSALANENLVIDESISQSDIEDIRTSAKRLKEIFDKREKKLTDLAEGVMTKLLTEIVGHTAPDGRAIANAVSMASADSSLMDFLYSVGRISNPVIGAMGAIIRKAQDSRDAKINDIAYKIRVATNKLFKAGHDSEFMYEDEGHIVSDINWAEYNSAREAAKKALRRQGLNGFDFKQALEDWEDQNTEDRIVDTTNGRTEKVPDYRYRKTEDFKRGWSKEQVEYYDTMMQIKGEIGSMLPAYAQHQYLPPQVRRKFLDALSDAKGIKDVGKAVKNKIKDFYTVREDDDQYGSNGIIDGEEYGIAYGDFDNTPLRQIPIFFVNRVEQGELLRNFSTGLQALAGTAINYNAMSEIADVVEFIGDFVKDQPTREEDPKSDMVQTKEIKVFKDLWRRGLNSNTSALIEGFISQYIYGQYRDPNENKLWSKIFGNIIGYTSFKSLSTNLKGAFANYLMGEFQMMIDAGCGEFYGFKDYIWAHAKLCGKAGVPGDIAELFTNNVRHKSVLMRDVFDPLNENFAAKSHTEYHSNLFRQFMSKDCSFIGYSSGEYLIHYVNMYSVLHHEKVLLNGKEVSLYDAIDVSEVQDGNAKLVLKDEVTDLKGNAITSLEDPYIEKIRKRIRYCNQSMHGAMNAEDKGLLHQRWWGRGIMNFRQWMVEHFSRRLRATHFDYTLGENREGYWYSLYKALVNDDVKDAWNNHQYAEVMGMFMKDLYAFTIRSTAQWDNLTDMQKYNIKRVQTEMLMYLCLLGLGFALGEPDEHKREFWRRWWIYQTKRAILDTEAAMPHPKAITNMITLIQSPMACVNTMASMMYVFYGLTNGDLFEDIQSGDHQGENKYWRNVKKYALPFFKDYEQLQKMDTDDAIFKVFDSSPSNK